MMSHFWVIFYPPPPLIQFLPSIIRFFGVILDPPPLKLDIIYVGSLVVSTLKLHLNDLGSN